MTKQFEIAQKMTEKLKGKGCKVALACVGESNITIKALYAGVWFEYAYENNKLFVTCNGEIIEEMSYTF